MPGTRGDAIVAWTRYKRPVEWCSSASRGGVQVGRTPYHCGFCKEQGSPLAREADVSGATATVFYCAGCKAILRV